MVRLPDSVTLPNPRQLVPGMVAIHRRHPQLNIMNVEAAAAAHLVAARVALSAGAARGILPAVLDEENIAWDVVNPS